MNIFTALCLFCCILCSHFGVFYVHAWLVVQDPSCYRQIMHKKATSRGFAKACLRGVSGKELLLCWIGFVRLGQVGLSRLGLMDSVDRLVGLDWLVGWVVLVPFFLWYVWLFLGFAFWMVQQRHKCSSHEVCGCWHCHACWIFDYGDLLCTMTLDRHMQNSFFWRPIRQRTVPIQHFCMPEMTSFEPLILKQYPVLLLVKLVKIQAEESQGFCPCSNHGRVLRLQNMFLQQNILYPKCQGGMRHAPECEVAPWKSHGLLQKGQGQKTESLDKSIWDCGSTEPAYRAYSLEVVTHVIKMSVQL